MKRIVKEAVIEKKLTDEEKDIIRSHLECNYKIVMLYPINENTDTLESAEGISELIYQCGKEIKEYKESLK